MRAQAAAFKFQPFSIKQKQVLTWWMDPSPYIDYDMIICDGSIRAGKTVAMIDSFVTWSLATFQNENFILAGRSMGALKRNVLKPMFQILAAKAIPYRYIRSGSDARVEIGSNTYYLFGANNEASQDVLQGLTAAGALADEAALFPESFIEQMIGRCSVEGSKIWLNCNPEGPFHYIKTEYIDKAAEKKVLHLHFTLDDNLSLSPKIKERYKRMFTGLWFKRMILGLWVLAEGVIYDMFDDQVHLIDDPKKLPEKFQAYYLGVDYGTGNPTVLLLLGQAGNNLYVVDEYYWDSSKTGRQKTDVEYSRDLREFIKGRYPRAICIDPSAASFILQLRKDGVGGIRKANNSVIDGIRTVASHFGEQRLFIYGPKCPNLLKELTNYVWDPKAQERGEDKPVKANDHALDALRYVLHTMFSRTFGVSNGKPKGW
ncbi:MAG: PBSX family phage terminase large subunit [Syntrophomonadaceae bacterium]|nr:PBSX family phage terminase large subunit [Syntrophomonadaceae bacterium]